MSTAAFFYISVMKQENAEIVQGLRRRNPDLLDQLIERYHYRLMRYLLHLTGNRETAEDVFQETWVRVLERGHQYNGKAKFETWLFSVARHLVIDLFRKKKPASLEVLGGGQAKTRDRLRLKAPASRRLLSLPPDGKSPPTSAWPWDTSTPSTGKCFCCVSRKSCHSTRLRESWTLPFPR